MSATGFRRLIDIGSGEARQFLVVEVTDPKAPRPLVLELDLDTGGGAYLELDYSEGGLLFDALAQALGVIVAGQARPQLRLIAQEALEATTGDTPTGEGS